MRVLVALETCDDPRYAGKRRIIRESWAKSLPAGYDFQECSGSFLKCPDSYEDLCIKTREICRYAVANDYDWLIIVDDDVTVQTSNLVIPTVDYSGMVLPRGQNRSFEIIPYASGGFYWMSRRVFSIIANAELSATITAEDRWVGATLAKHGFCPVDNPYVVIETCHCGKCSPEPLIPDWVAFIAQATHPA